MAVTPQPSHINDGRGVKLRKARRGGGVASTREKRGVLIKVCEHHLVD